MGIQRRLSQTTRVNCDGPGRRTVVFQRLHVVVHADSLEFGGMDPAKVSCDKPDHLRLTLFIRRPSIVDYAG